MLRNTSPEILSIARRIRSLRREIPSTKQKMLTFALSLESE